MNKLECKSEASDNISSEGMDVFDRLINAAKLEWNHGVDTTKFLYQRGPTLSKRQQYRVRAVERDLADAAKTLSQPLSHFFSPTSLVPTKAPLSVTELPYQARQAAIMDLEKKLRSKKINVEGQNLTRHRAVLALLYTTQSRQGGETREELSYQVARAFRKGLYFARRVVEWEGNWIRERTIPKGK